MRRFVTFASVLAVLLLGLVATVGQRTAAQEATPDTTAMMAMADHPIVGAWRWDNNPANPGVDLTYAIFHADGTYIEPTPGGANIGTWEPTGPRTALLTALVVFDLDQDATTDDPPGTGILRLAAEVDEAGETITAPFTFEVLDATGATVFTGDFEAIGTRIAVEPMVPFGTPVAGTPTA